MEHLARLQWRMDRAERMQDNVVAAHVEKVAAERQEKTVKLRYRYVDRVDVLDVLQGCVPRRDFYAPPGLIHEFVTAYGDPLQGQAVRILELLHRLREPEKRPRQRGPLPAGATDDHEWEAALAWWAEKDDTPVPQPKVPVAQEAAERDELREELSALVRLEKQAQEAVWEPFFAQGQQPLTTAERDVVAAQMEPRLDRLRRHEESCLRQLWRLGNFLMHIQDRAKPQDAEREPEHEDRNPESETKAESEVPHSESGMEPERAVRNSESGMEEDSAVGSCPNTPVPPNGAVGPNSVRPAIEGVQPIMEGDQPIEQCVHPCSASIRPGVGDVQPTMDVVRPHSGGIRQDAEIGMEELAVESEESTQSTSKNEGASGDVYENTGKGNVDARQIDPIPAAVARPADASMTSVKAERDRKSDSKAQPGASGASKAAAA